MLPVTMSDTLNCPTSLSHIRSTHSSESHRELNLGPSYLYPPVIPAIFHITYFIGCQKNRATRLLNTSLSYCLILFLIKFYIYSSVFAGCRKCMSSPIMPMPMPMPMPFQSFCRDDQSPSITFHTWHKYNILPLCTTNSAILFPLILFKMFY